MAIVGTVDVNGQLYEQPLHRPKSTMDFVDERVKVKNNSSVKFDYKTRSINKLKLNHK